MPVAPTLSKRENRLLTVALKTVVSKTPKSAGVFDRLVQAGLLGADGRATEAGRQALRAPQDTPHANSDDFGAGLDVNPRHKGKYQSGDRRNGTRH